MKIVYYSGSGNTEKMANLIAEGIKEEGKTAELINVSSAGLDAVSYTHLDVYKRQVYRIS